MPVRILLGLVQLGPTVLPKAAMAHVDEALLFVSGLPIQNSLIALVQASYLGIVPTRVLA